MDCTRHFLNFTWSHHSWRPRVTASETRVALETNMWARVVEREFVRCDKDEICEVCGKTRKAISCICDTERGARCRIRCEWLAAAEAR